MFHVFWIPWLLALEIPSCVLLDHVQIYQTMETKKLKKHQNENHWKSSNTCCLSWTLGSLSKCSQSNLFRYICGRISFETVKLVLLFCFHRLLIILIGDMIFFSFLIGYKNRFCVLSTLLIFDSFLLHVFLVLGYDFASENKNRATQSFYPSWNAILQKCHWDVYLIISRIT